MAIFELKTPVEIDGNMTKEIEYDLESLTGKDTAQAIKDLAKHKIVVTMTEIDQNYHAAVFAISAGIAFEDVQRLSAKDYVRVCNTVRDFFLED